MSAMDQLRLCLAVLWVSLVAVAGGTLALAGTTWMAGFAIVGLTACAVGTGRVYGVVQERERQEKARRL